MYADKVRFIIYPNSYIELCDNTVNIFAVINNQAAEVCYIVYTVDTQQVQQIEQEQHIQ